jgi:hypothetical protein
MHLPNPRKFLLIPVLVAIGSVAQAQVTTGAYSVQVADRVSGQVPANATITLKSSALFQPRTYKADASGLIRAVLLPVGNYEVEVSAPGYQTAKVLDVRIGVGANLSQNVSLVPVEPNTPVIVTVVAASADMDGGVDFADAGAEQ